jgi:hypothetical protein
MWPLIDFTALFADSTQTVVKESYKLRVTQGEDGRIIVIMIPLGE